MSGHTMSGMHNMTGTEDTGTSATSGGYTLKLASASAPAHKATTLRFAVNGPDGKPVSNYEVDQTKKLHLYVIRTDLADYQHLHPSLSNDGNWSTPITFDQPGKYRVIADFIAATGKGAHHVLGASLTVPGAWTKTALPAPAAETSVDGYSVRVSGDLRAGVHSPLDVRITRNGQPVTDLQPYLGVWAHLGAFDEKTLGVTHLHPTQEPMQGMAMDSPRTLRFSADLPAAGEYRVFVQFQTAGSLHTAAITVRVR